MLELLVSVGGLIAIAIFASILIVLHIETEKEIRAFFMLVATVGLILYLTKQHPVSWIETHYVLCATLFVTYFAIGTLWAIWKWYLYAWEIRTQVIKAGSIKAWQTSMSRYIKIPLQVSEHKSRVLGWMAYWPWSAMWWVLHSPVRRIWNGIYNGTAAVFQRVSNRVFKDVSDVPRVAVDGTNIHDFSARGTVDGRGEPLPTKQRPSPTALSSARWSDPSTKQ
jgi:hypothetical protein